MGKAEIEASLATLTTWIQIFGLLVAVGIVGEVGVGIRHWLLDRRLQSLQHIEDQERQANIARLNNDAEAARRDIANANARAAESNERAAKAEQAAAEANLALEKFKAPRKLTPEQSERITESVKKWSGTKFTLAVFDDPEPIELMAQIENALNSAGWIEDGWKGGGAIVLSRPGRPNVGFSRVQGLFIQADGSHAAEFGWQVGTLASALTAEGIAVTPEIGHMSPNTNNEVIQIQIGKKP
jgi:hypothetical protein